MTDKDFGAGRARGQAMRNARLARARTIRRRVIAGAVALFVASWLLITLVLVSGRDPALAKNSSASTATSSTSGRSGSSQSSDTSSSSQSSSPSSVTTSQS